MAKTTSVASANAAADIATAAEVTGGKSVVDVVDALQDGQSAAMTDTGPVQGETVAAKEARETIEMPYFDKQGNQLGVNFIVRY